MFLGWYRELGTQPQRRQTSVLGAQPGCGPHIPAAARKVSAYGLVLSVFLLSSHLEGSWGCLFFLGFWGFEMKPTSVVTVTLWQQCPCRQRLASLSWRLGAIEARGSCFVTPFLKGNLLSLSSLPVISWNTRLEGLSPQAPWGLMKCAVHVRSEKTSVFLMVVFHCRPAPWQGVIHHPLSGYWKFPSPF